MNHVFLQQVLAWAKQHHQRLAGALAGLIAKQELLETLLVWLQWAETTLSEKDKEVIPQEIEEVKTLIAEHQVNKLDAHQLAFTSVSSFSHCFANVFPSPILMGLLLCNCPAAWLFQVLRKAPLLSMKHPSASQGS